MSEQLKSKLVSVASTAITTDKKNREITNLKLNSEQAAELGAALIEFSELTDKVELSLFKENKERKDGRGTFLSSFFICKPKREFGAETETKTVYTDKADKLKESIKEKAERLKNA